MTWVKIANSFPSHPKILRAGPEAAHLFVCSICYANEHLLDGVISRELLAGVAPGLRGPEKHAKRLCDVGLWETTNSGWRIHDYLEHQRPATAIRETRALDSERKRTYRSARSPNGLRPDSGQDSSRARAGAPSREVEVEVEVEGPPVVPQGGRQRDRVRFDKDCASYAALHFPDADPDLAMRAVRQSIRYGHARTLQQIQDFAAVHFPELRTEEKTR